MRRVSSSMIAKTRQSRNSAMRSTLVMMPLNDAPKSRLYSSEGRDSTAIRTLSRTPVSQSVVDSVEVNRTGRSATLTGGGSAPPRIHDLPATTSGPITRDESFPAGVEFFVFVSVVLVSAGFELRAREFESPPLGNGEVCPLPPPGVRTLPLFAVLPAPPGNRLATPKPPPTVLRAAPRTGGRGI